MNSPIRLIVADIDGCLSRGSTNPFSPRLIDRLIETNALAKEDPTVPPVTFCTGRPQPYVECLIQVTHGYMPALCESGTVLFDPVHHTVTKHPGFGAREEAQLAKLNKLIEAEFVRGKVMCEPGKVTHTTLLVGEPFKPVDLLPRAQELIREFDGAFDIEMTRMCLHFLFRHLHNGTGLQWLSEYTGIPVSQMAGIGDARTDLPFLRMLPLTCAPSGAHQDVKDICSHVSEACDADAAVEFLDFIIAHNRA
jgi:hydroxymethylpyrimidine pyrophosphatase-like HAD family hydrolase